MKAKLMSILCVLMLALTSCGGEAGKAKDAFDNGTLKIGSTYEEVVNTLGAGDHEYESPRMKIVRYRTLISFYYIRLEPGSDGVMRVVETTTDGEEGTAWEVKDNPDAKFF